MTKRYQDEIREVIEVLYFEPPPLPSKDRKRRSIKVAAYRKKVLDRARDLNLSSVQIAQIHHCLENPIAKKELFAQYNRYRVEEAKSSGESSQELTSERSFIVATKFLNRWEREGVALLVPNGGVIPGFPDNGPAAAAEVLEQLRQDGVQVDSAQNPVPPSAPSGIP